MDYEQKLLAEIERRRALKASRDQVNAEIEKRKALEAIAVERDARQKEMAQLEGDVDLYNTLGAASTGISQGLGLFGSWSDEISSLMEANFSDKTYEQLQAEKEQRMAGAYEESPVAAYGSELAASLVGGRALLKGLEKVNQLKSLYDKNIIRKPLNIALAGITGAGSAEGEDKGTGAETGAYISAGLEAIPYLGKGIKAISNVTGLTDTIRETGRKLGRASLGLQFKDYLRAGIRELPKDDNGVIYKAALEQGPGGEEAARYSSRLATATNELLEQGKIPATRDPAALASHVGNKIETLAIDRDKLIKQYDEIFDAANEKIAKETKPVVEGVTLFDASGKLIKKETSKQAKAGFAGANFIDLDQWEKFIQEQGGRLSPEDKTELINYAKDLAEQHGKVSKGRLNHLFQLKEQVGDKAFKVARDEPLSAKQSMYNQLYYKMQEAVSQKNLLGKGLDKLTEGLTGEQKLVTKRDLNNKIRSVVGTVENITEEISKFKTLQAPLRYQLLREEGSQLGTKLANAINTTGGFAAPAILGATIGGASKENEEDSALLKALIGAGLGVGYKKLVNRSGQRNLSESLVNLANRLEGRTAPRVSPSAEAIKNVIIRGQARGNENPMAIQEAETLVTQAPEEQVLENPVVASTQRPIVSTQKELKNYIQSQDPIIRAIIKAESNADYKAKSSKGAIGLMQLMPQTAKALGVKNRYDPIDNIEGGKKYYQQNLEKFKDKKLALAAYNWGPGNTQKAINQLKKKKIPINWENIIENIFVPKETRDYVNKVLKLEAE
jgi:hypothetical protein